MPTKTKIKITDNPELRNVLDTQYEAASQVKLCQYALLLATHILDLVDFYNKDNIVIQEGFLVNQQWQKGKARMHEVRQAGFKIHQMAKAYDDVLIKTALRVAGQSVATAHMKEHAMVASDYAVKVINIKFPHDLEAVKQERQWQIDTMNSIEDSVSD